MRKLFVFILLTGLIIFNNHQNIYSFSINGNNIIWSPKSDTGFIYWVQGKSSGSKIWKIYDLEKSRGRTIFSGGSLTPSWSYDARYIAFAKKNEIILIEGARTKTFKTSIDDIISLDWSLKGEKITYSDGEKIYILEVNNNNNYFVTKGENPLFVGNDKKILYFDENMQVNLLDETLKSRVVIKEMVRKIHALKNQDRFIFQLEKIIKLYDLESDMIYTLAEDGVAIADFYVSYDFEFMTYNNNAGEHFLVHIPTMRKMKILTDRKYYAEKLSGSNKYCAYEKSGQIEIKEMNTYLSAFELNMIYKASFGIADELPVNAELEIYQEKKNPFSGKLIGYEKQNFKGLLKVIIVYENYCYGMLDKEFSTTKAIEVGDAVVWKAENKLGLIMKK